MATGRTVLTCLAKKISRFLLPDQLVEVGIINKSKLWPFLLDALHDFKAFTWMRFQTTTGDIFKGRAALWTRLRGVSVNSQGPTRRAIGAEIT